MKILVINGPNLNMLGIREPDIYGKNTYKDLVDMIDAHCKEKGIEVEQYQSNHEGDLVDKIQYAYKNYVKYWVYKVRQAATRFWKILKYRSRD